MAVILVVTTLPAALGAQPLQLVSSERGTMGQATASDSSFHEAISADGRFVVFASEAFDLVTGLADPIFTYDLFVHDTLSGLSQLVSRSAVSPGAPANQETTGPATISGDGCFIAFESPASDLVAGMVKANSFSSKNVFLFDRVGGTMTLVSHAMGSPTTTGNLQATNAIISRDGRFVAFESGASDLVANDTNNMQDVFLFDRTTGDIELVSHKTGTSESAGGESELGSISADGAWVAFQSRASDLANIMVDINLERDVFVFERATGAVTLVSHAAGAPLTTSGGFAVDPVISADGDWVVWSGPGDNLVVGQVDSNSAQDIFLWDRMNNTANLVSRSSAGVATAGNAGSTSARISDHGRFVAFHSSATDLVSGQMDTNNDLDAFLYDDTSGDVILASRAAGSSTTTPNDGVEGFALSGDGQSVVFSSRATNVVAGQIGGGLLNLFLYRPGPSDMVLVSHTAGSTQTVANGTSSKPRVSRHGNVSFESTSTDFGFSDANSGADVFVVLPAIFGDGFESGSTSAWSQAVP
jgi:Tol biopolymer transport system component